MARPGGAPDWARRLTAAVFLAGWAVSVAAAEEPKAPDERTRVIAELTERLTSRNRADRIAALEGALKGDDSVLRTLAVETALQTRDPVMANLALKDWLSRRKAIPVLLYALKEEPNGEAVLGNLGPLTLTMESLDAGTGAVVATLGAPGYGVTRDSTAVGVLTRADLTLNTFGCALALRLTEHRTLDGLFRCQTLPAFAARITLD